MSEWDDRVNAHQAVQLIRQLSDTLSPIVVGEGDLAHLEALERARQAAANVQRLVNSADPQLIAPVILERMVAPAQGALSAAQAYVAAPDAGQVAQLNANLDTLLDAAAALIAAAPILAEEQQREGATQFRQAGGQLLRRMKEDAEQFSSSMSSSLAELTEKAEETRLAMEAQGTEGQEKLAQLKAAIDVQETHLSSIVATQQQQFADAETSRQAASADAMTQQRLSFETLTQDFKAAADAHNAELEGKSKEGLDQLALDLEKAKSLVNAVGENAFAAGHGIYANEEKEAANTWRRVTVEAVGVIVGLGLIYLLTVGGTEFTWQGRR